MASNIPVECPMARMHQENNGGCYNPTLSLKKETNPDNALEYTLTFVIEKVLKLGRSTDLPCTGWPLRFKACENQETIIPFKDISKTAEDPTHVSTIKITPFASKGTPPYDPSFLNYRGKYDIYPGNNYGGLPLAE